MDVLPNPAAAGSSTIFDTLLAAYDPPRGWHQLGYHSKNTPLGCGKVTHCRDLSPTCF